MGMQREAPMSPSLKTVCSWCKRVVVDGPAEPVTHGICPVCEVEFRRQLKASLAGVARAR